MIFVVVELTETDGVYVEDASLSTGALRFLSCGELFGNSPLGGLVFKASIEELGSLSDSRAEVLLGRSNCGSRGSGRRSAEVVARIAVVVLEIDVWELCGSRRILQVSLEELWLVVEVSNLFVDTASWSCCSDSEVGSRGARWEPLLLLLLLLRKCWSGWILLNE